MPEPKDQGNQPPVEPEQKFKIKVQGEEKEVPLSELLELAQKGDDYTKKTSELSEREKKIDENIQSEAERIATDWIEQEEVKNKKPPEDPDLDPNEKRIRQLEADIANLKDGSKKSEAGRLELQYETQLKKLKVDYPMLDEQVILATMYGNPKLRMEDIAKQDHEKRTKEKDEWIKSYLEDKKKQPKMEGGGSRSLPITPEKELDGKSLEKGDVKRAATKFINESIQGA